MMSYQEMLQFAIDSGMVDLHTIREMCEMKQRQKYLDMHTYSIWQNDKGKWFTYVPDESAPNKRKVIKRTSKGAIEDYIVDYYEKLEHKIYILDVFREWIEQKLEFGEIQKQTYDRYYTDALRFFNNEINDIEFYKIDSTYLEEFVKMTIKNEKLSAKSYSNLRTILIGTFKYGRKHNYTNLVIRDFLDNIDLSKKAFTKKVKADGEQVFNSDEKNKILSYINNTDYTLCTLGIKLAFYTGLRAGELAAIKKTDVVGNVLKIRRTEVRVKDEEGHYTFYVRESPKTDAGIRDIMLIKEAKDTIQEVLKINPFGEYLFEDCGRRLKGKAFTVRLYKLCDTLAIPRRSLHKVRKTYGTNLRNGNVDKAVIINQMGHTDIATTDEHYLFNDKLETEMLRQIQSALS